MPTVHVSLDGMQAIHQNLNGLIHNLENIDGLLDEIGKYMVSSTRNRILRQKRAPDGSRWAPNAPATIARKGHGRILYQTGALAAGIYVSEQDHDSVTISASPDTPYAEYMQDGFHNKRTGRDVPARPFMGVSEANHKRIRRMINDYLRKANGG